MPLYIGDYLADTTHLSAAESGAYLHLLMHYWRSGLALLDDDNSLMRIAKMRPAEWKTSKVTVKAFFKPAVMDGERVLTHVRVEKELVKAGVKYASRKAASDAANAARKAKLDATRQEKLDAQREADRHGEPHASQPQPQPQPSFEGKDETSLRSVSPPREANGTRWPSEAKVPHDWFEDAEAQCRNDGFPPPDLRKEAGKFERYWASKPGKDARKADWKKTWINWVLKAAEDGRGQRNGKLGAHEKFLRGGALSAGYDLGDADDNAGANGGPSGPPKPALLEAGLYGASRKAGI